MNKRVLFVFMIVLLMTTISADYLGSKKIDEPMDITNYCRSGVCTYINLTSIEYPNGTIIYPNAAMTKNGQAYNYSFTPDQFGMHTFVSCGDSTIDVCDKDTFFVNLNGEENSVGIMIILLLFFSVLFMGYHKLNEKINYEKWHDGLMKKYEDKNYIKLVLSSVGYNLIKNKVGIYYVMGLPIMLVLANMIVDYQINILSDLIQNLLMVYMLGVIMIAFLFIGQAQEFVVGIIDDKARKSWGLQ